MKDISKKVLILQDKKGLALVLAMFILVFIAILLIAFLEIITSDLQITTNHLGRLKAVYIADAGIEYAISQLRINRYWTATSETWTFPLNSGNSYTVTKIGTSRLITSYGIIDNKFTATIEAKVSIKGTSSPYTIRIVSWKET